MTIPVTVFTGFIGAGKTTIILSLLKRLPKDYKVCVLKNEFGDAKTDSELARENNVEIQEMINGCICCVLVGQMKLALLEIKEKYNPDRIIIETSGSAFPAPIAWQIRQLEPDGFTLDAIITVVDCENFTGYEDTSYTARLQAQYTDVILLNKHESVTEQVLDTVMDRVNDLNTDTAKVKCEGTQGVNPDLIFGLDTELFRLTESKNRRKSEHEEHGEGSSCTSTPSGNDIDTEHHDREVDLIKIDRKVSPHREPLTIAQFESFLSKLSKDEVYRVKGLARLLPDNSASSHVSIDPSAHIRNLYIVNWAFGRSSLIPVTRESDDPDRKFVQLRLTMMGVDLEMYRRTVMDSLNLEDGELEVFPRRQSYLEQ